MNDSLFGPALRAVTPDQGPPPRTVEPWTRVEGHVLSRGSSGSVCSCGGWRGEGTSGSSDGHVRDAWPVLVPREDHDVDLRAWARRVEVVLRQAVERHEEQYVLDGHDQPLRDGEAIPVLTQAYVDTGSRVEVLEHQLEELRDRIRQAGA